MTDLLLAAILAMLLWPHIKNARQILRGRLITWRNQRGQR